MENEKKDSPTPATSGVWVGLVMIGLVVLLVAIEMIRMR